MARRNVERWVPNRVELRETNWLGGFPASSLDVIVSNPPYVRAGDEHLGALRFEPESALVAGADGLDAIRRIVQDGFEVLASGGLIAVEHGHDQQADVMALMRSQGFEAICGLSDLAGVPGRDRRETMTMDDDQLLRYSRQIMMGDIEIEGREELLDATVLIVGLGGLGLPGSTLSRGRRRGASETR
ncbi:MAG: hypothetical protein U5O39_03285 [Gammaproteobacteria bacterium]|nr:hypothetical protein [Gammaproteobacteria bacterium]